MPSARSVPPSPFPFSSLARPIRHVWSSAMPFRPLCRRLLCAGRGRAVADDAEAVAWPRAESPARPAGLLAFVGPWLVMCHRGKGKRGLHRHATPPRRPACEPRPAPMVRTHKHTYTRTPTHVVLAVEEVG